MQLPLRRSLWRGDGVGAFIEWVVNSTLDYFMEINITKINRRVTA